MSSYNTTFSYNDYSPSDGQIPYNNRPHEQDAMGFMDSQQEAYNYDEADTHVDHGVRQDTEKNIKLLNEIVSASVVPNEPKESRSSSSSSSRSGVEETEKWINLFIEYVKEPVIMIILYIVFHGDYVQDALSTYLPSNYNNPNNIIKFYGARGFAYVVCYYAMRNYKC
jgi:hypothetical protein